MSWWFATTLHSIHKHMQQKSKFSKAAAEQLFNEFILQFGFPKRIHHNKGPEFNSNIFHHLHKIAGIRSSNMTPYHPMGDGRWKG